MKNKLSKLLLNSTNDKKLIDSIVRNVSEEITYEVIEKNLAEKRKLEREIIDLEQSINLNATNVKAIMINLFSHNYKLMLLNQKIEKMQMIYDLYF